ncbi:TRAP transporter permease [Acuticoccus sp. I52.16.1]|uniref:TRAP transporter permease n=1 Tax=Acuticoccus sp. I52.16.1 TaxID=2928472 RepID=UPI001FD2FAFC|nr:TRAP transporter permease [Acuticoccus sp. I52.16.1]UOM35510.1 TRAP transporter permease [Acuticoccus sp. I52.16.1]
MMKRLTSNWGVTAVGAVALTMSLYHLWVAFFGPPDAQKFRAIHLTFVMAIAFLMLPGRGYRDPQTGKPGIFDIVLLVIAVAASTYPIFFYDYFVNRMYYVDELRIADFVFGSALILLVLEATRRAVGWALPATAAAFLIYTLVWMGFGLEITLDQLYLTTEGIFGIPLGVSATYIVLFILFGALVERSGAGRLFMDFAMSLTGHAAGGPAKVACVTSGLFGSVSGSAVANVMTTGVFTIPLMQRIGYKKGFSGAVEAVASTGGQIMPPIMGAAAFVMAEFLGIGYLEVAAFALFPAILYYVALFMAVHFEAKRTGMVGLPRSELPSLKETLLTRGHLFLPLIIIIVTLLMGYSAPLSALAGIVSVVPTAMLRKETRKDISLDMIGDALISGAKNTVPVALACACAGIVVGCITLTNLGTEFTGLVIAVSQDSLVLALVLTMIAGIVLGMGMPTTPAYIVQVALLVPALVKLGVMVEAAHMFVFYYAILSAITPPVAMAVYAANGISRAGLWDTGFAALKLGATGYIIPFMFVFGPSILLIGEWPVIVTTLMTALIGVVCLAGGMTGFLIARASIVERLILIAAAITLIKPGLWTDLTGIAMAGAVLAFQYVVGRNAQLSSKPAQ